MAWSDWLVLHENIALTMVQTLFAREHNRIVDALPESLPEQSKFDIARQFVIATQQYITYNEFLPALGLHLAPALRYRPEVDVSVSTEFASVGYRAHSMIHGAIEMSVPVDRFSDEELAALSQKGIGIEEAVADTSVCLDGPTLPECFMLASDVGTIDVFRARDHGIARYNELRQSFGLPRVSTFAELTGEAGEEFPLDDTMVDTTDPINDPDILDFVELRDTDDQLLVPGSDLGALQHAMWKQQFEALRDGDSNFYLWNDSLSRIMRSFGNDDIAYRQSLADVIINNTELQPGDIQIEIFLSAE